MTIACGDCAACGKCYLKIRPCPTCGRTCDYEESTCAACGAPITEEHREAARTEYRRQKKEEHDFLFAHMKRGKFQN